MSSSMPSSKLPPMPALVKSALPTSCDLAVEQKVWVEGRVVNVRFRVGIPSSSAMANLMFDALRPVMAMSVSQQSLRLESQYRKLEGDSAYVTFEYTWQGSATMAVWEISDLIGSVMDVRRIMHAAFEHHERYHVVSIKGVDPEIEDLSKTEARRHIVCLNV